MSRRFGRNQKRRAREKIKGLEDKVCQLEQLGARDRQIVEETADVLGNYFMTLPPKTIEVRTAQDLEREYRMPIVAGTQDSQHFCETVIPLLRGSVHLNGLAEHAHVAVRLNDHWAAYGIKPESLLLRSRRYRIPYMTQEIAKILAVHLSNSMENEARD